jgi:hypothetical protein
VSGGCYCRIGHDCERYFKQVSSGNVND